MRSSVKTLITAFSLLATTLVVGIAGYMILGSASFVDSMFMVVITVFSVGYEETIRVDEPVLKWFTTGIIVAGCSSLLYAVGGFIQMATEGEIARAFERQRHGRDLENLKRHAIICGFGRMGQMIAQELTEARYPFVIVDNDDERTREAEEMGYIAVKGDATEEDILHAARIDTAKSLATVLPNDAANVFITLSARNLSPKLTILARGELPSTERKLTQAGADHVVLPAAIGGLRLAHMIVKPTASHLIDTLENATMINDDLEQLGVRLNEIYVHSSSPAAERNVGQLEIAGHGAYLIVAIRRVSGEVVRHPDVTTTVHAGDVVIVIGHGDEKPAFVAHESPAREVARDAPAGDESI